MVNNYSSIKPLPDSEDQKSCNKNQFIAPSFTATPIVAKPNNSTNLKSNVNHQQTMRESEIYSLTTKNKSNSPDNGDESKKEKENILIVGDSIVQKIESYKLRKSMKSNVFVKSISGATSKGMIHHLKGSIEDCKPNKVIIHCATNDLSKKITPKDICDNISEMIESCSGKEIFISGLVYRDEKYNSKVREVNEILYDLTKQGKAKFIDNSNITSDMLNRGKLHLNNSGVANLVKKIRKALTI